MKQDSRTTFFGGTVFLACCHLVLADELSESEEPMADSSNLRQGIDWVSDKLNGEFSLEYFDYFRDSANDPTDPYFGADLTLDITGNFSDTTSYVIVPHFRSDNGERTAEFFDFLERSQSRYYANFDEVFADYYASNFRLTVGKQIYSWGVSDTYKPVENLNPYDVVDLPTAEKMGVYSVGASGIWDSFSLETVLIPWFTPTRLPRSDNRWIGNAQAQTRQLRNLLGFDPNVVYNGRDMPANTLDNLQGGVRLASSSLITGWDLGLTYIQGRDPIGALRATPATLPTVNVQQIYQRFHEFGTTVSTTFGSVEAHIEAAYRDTIENDYDDDFVEYVAGINYTYYNFPGVQELRLVLEYAGESVIERKTVGNDIVPTSQYIRPFKNSFLGSAEFRFTEETQFQLASALNFEDYDFFFQPKLSHKFYSGIQLDIGLDFMEGNQNSFFGHWDTNNRLFVMASYAF